MNTEDKKDKGVRYIVKVNISVSPIITELILETKPPITFIQEPRRINCKKAMMIISKKTLASFKVRKLFAFYYIKMHFGKYAVAFNLLQDFNIVISGALPIISLLKMKKANTLKRIMFVFLLLFE